MSSPYREARIPDRVEERSDEPQPLVTFDVSGRRGADGVHGTPGPDGHTTGADGWDGGDAGPAEPGQSAGQIRLVMKADDEAGAAVLGGELFPPGGGKQEIARRVLIDEAGFIPLNAVGGDGGRGGNGGRGGDGARGADGADATRWSSGSNGGDGGDGGRGGNATSGGAGGDGGQIVVTVAEADTPLLMLIRTDVRGGSGGAAGINGAGGSGGAGGDGGDSYSWSETETYTDASGQTQTRTRYHSNSGGWDGSHGSAGRPGGAMVRAGAPGHDGSFAIQVTGEAGVQTYRSRYDLRLVAFSHDSLNEDAVYEPRELVRVFDLVVENVGGMPTPSKDELALGLARGGWVVPEPGELRCVPGLPPGDRYAVPGELRFRIKDHAPAGPGEPLEVEETILQRAMLPSVRREFEHYQGEEARALGTFVIRYPLRVSAVRHLRSLAAGEATRVRFEITNQSRFALGGGSPCRRTIRVRVATAPDSELGDEHVAFVVDGRELPPSTGWVHELPVLDRGDTAALELIVRLGDTAPEYLRYAAHVTLELGDLDEPGRARPIQLRGFDVRVARRFAVSDAGVLLVVNHRTTREEIEAWEQLGERLAFTTALWDVSREGHLDLERPLAGGFTLADWFARKAVVVLDNAIEGPDGPSYPHLYLAEDQVVRAASAGIDFAFVGKGMPLARVLVPGGEPAVTPVHRTYWVRWWAKPTEDWLAREALELSDELSDERPDRRHVVIHRFAPELDGDSRWFNRWRVGTLEVRRTLDAAAGAIVHAELDDDALHDPARATGDRVATALLVMFDFDENLERLRRLLERADGLAAAEPAAEPAPELAAVIDALVLDLANELAAVIAPGWLGDASGAELAATLPRVERLASAGLTAGYTSAAGVALRQLAGRVRFLASSQVRWWELLPPLRWMRRGPVARGHLGRHLDRLLAGAFGDHQLEQARDEVDDIARLIEARHREQRRISFALKRRFWALEQARLPIAERTITSDTELLVTPADRVMPAAEYDAVAAQRAADAERRARLLAEVDREHAALFVDGGDG